LKSSLMERFLAKVNKDGPIIREELGPCWIWIGAFPKVGGYGEIRAWGKTRKATRVSYELFNGHLPDDLVACHKCDNPPCVRPDHLWAGTHSENARDKFSKGRGRNGWQKQLGRPFTKEHIEHLKAAALTRSEPRFNRGSTIISAEQALCIQLGYSRGVKQADLAQEYNVDPKCISKIVRGLRKGMKPVVREKGYGTGQSSGMHGNAKKVRTPEQKAAHAALMREKWANGAYENRKPGELPERDPETGKFLHA
jgi:hypothetical protein